MAFAYFDRVKETTTTTGTGVIALAGAVVGFQAFSAKYANGDTMHYAIFHAASGAWEVGLGTWSTGNNLTRTTVLDSSNGGAAVNFAAGTKEVFVVFPAAVPSGMSAAFFSTPSSTTRDAISTAALRIGTVARLNSDGTSWIWNGSAWVLFVGFTPTGTATGQTQIWNGTAWVAGALDVADADAITGKLPYSNFVDGSACSLAGRGANTSGVQASIAAGTNGFVFLRRADAVTTALILNENVDPGAALVLSKLADGSACSVVARSANSTGAHADVASTTIGHILRIGTGPVLGFGSVDLSNTNTVGTSVLGVANGGDGISWNEIPSPANANTTYNISDGNHLKVPASLISGGAKNYTWAYSGTPVDGEIVAIDVDGQSSDLNICDSTIGSGTPICTVVAGSTKWRVVIQYNGASWLLGYRRRYP